ncbi:LegC family aminotransferase [Coprobacter tertius]|uniref:LegC family aminotransferase n=1 Tax=Coprobacter tertius TaxID=2944915 RepID=A0ABT1MH73_9BACT|nr:LegC family aminotransferase [Coprobacter tertius]MCP9610596.1 LegC family aminotransferase [Coprobacter tertius]
MFSEIVDFIRITFGGKEIVPLHAPCFVGNEKKYLEECIDTTFVSSVGKFVDRFESMMAEYTGAARAVVCVNGTSAIHMALLLAGVERGDEVITQPLTFIATCNALSYCGAHPVFIDVDTDTLGLSPGKMEEWLQKNSEYKGDALYNKKTGRRIKACVPMHTFGHPVRIDRIAELCSRYHLQLIEDAAESIGSFYSGRHTGTFGNIGAISFNGNKTITTGGGGVLLFSDKSLGDYAKHLTTQAKVPHPWEFVHDHIGYNYRMPNINAALGCAQLETLPLFLEKKRELADLYKNFFNELDITFVSEPENACSNYWLNAIIFKDRYERDEFLQYSNDHGIMTRPIWRLMNKLPMFETAECGDLQNCEYLEQRVVNIPSSVRL